MKSKPELSGVLQTDDKDPKRRETLGKIALWSNESENEKAPKFRGVLDIPKKGKYLDIPKKGKYLVDTRTLDLEV